MKGNTFKSEAMNRTRSFNVLTLQLLVNFGDVVLTEKYPGSFNFFTCYHIVTKTLVCFSGCIFRVDVLLPLKSFLRGLSCI